MGFLSRVFKVADIGDLTADAADLNRTDVGTEGQAGTRLFLGQLHQHEQNQEEAINNQDCRQKTDEHTEHTFLKLSF